jgi:hypothetical protein
MMTDNAEVESSGQAAKQRPFLEQESPHMVIKDLVRRESLEGVQRYTRSVAFNDSLKCDKALLS